MSDSHNLHILMTGVIAHRRMMPASPPLMSTLVCALGTLQGAMESQGLEVTREAALDVACIAFRIASELQSPGLPVVAPPTSEPLRLSALSGCD